MQLAILKLRERTKTQKNIKKNQPRETTDAVLPVSKSATGTKVAEFMSPCDNANGRMRLTSTFLPSNESVPLPVKVMFRILTIPAMT